MPCPYAGYARGTAHPRDYLIDTAVRAYLPLPSVLH